VGLAIVGFRDATSQQHLRFRFPSALDCADRSGIAPLASGYFFGAAPLPIGPAIPCSIIICILVNDA
jgi:hypothetical protein